MRSRREYDLSTATWHKSTHSGGDGGDCLEIAKDFPGAATWRISTHGGPDGGNRVDVCEDLHGLVPVRDSKASAGPALLFRAPAWAEFVAGLKDSAA